MREWGGQSAEGTQRNVPATLVSPSATWREKCVRERERERERERDRERERERERGQRARKIEGPNPAAW
jgi:hypothetical protein